ncbi:MAG: hypothetical protein QMC22_02165 [Pseudomonadales bacterium]
MACKNLLSSTSVLRFVKPVMQSGMGALVVQTCVAELPTNHKHFAV